MPTTPRPAPLARPARLARIAPLALLALLTLGATAAPPATALATDVEFNLNLSAIRVLVDLDPVFGVTDGLGVDGAGLVCPWTSDDPFGFLAQPSDGSVRAGAPYYDTSDGYLGSMGVDVYVGMGGKCGKSSS